MCVDMHMCDCTCHRVWPEKDSFSGQGEMLLINWQCMGNSRKALGSLSCTYANVNISYIAS